MIRKLLLVAAAIAMPVSAGAVALVATAGPAAAVTPINCHDTGTITFYGTSGLTHNGYITTATTSTTAVSAQTYTAGSSACTGTGPALSIKSTNTHCNAAGAATEIPACTGHTTSTTEYGYSSLKSYQAGGTTSVKADVTTLHFTVNSVAYTSTTCTATTCVGTCTATTCVAAHACPKSTTYGTEAGFEIFGKISAPATSPYLHGVTTAIVCLGKITGTFDLKQPGTPPATMPGFTYNLLQGELLTSPQDKITIKTATIDPLESSLNIA